jgi:hypothetical protein
MQEKNNSDFKYFSNYILHSATDPALTDDLSIQSLPHQSRQFELFKTYVSRFRTNTSKGMVIVFIEKSMYSITCPTKSIRAIRIPLLETDRHDIAEILMKVAITP